MIVLDASALADVLLDRPRGRRTASRLRGEELHAPHLVSIEVASVIRRSTLTREIRAETGGRALDDLRMFPLVRHDHEPFLPRIWQLRSNVSAYDAVYVALAEALDVPLLTCDARLARAPLPGVQIELMT